MKHINLFIIIISTLLLCSCKQDQWMDWKMQNEIWITQNAQKPDIITTPTGLQYKVIYQGNTFDTKPSYGSTIIVDYSLQLINGVLVETAQNARLVIQSSANANGLIEGFVEGLKKMNVGGDYILYIPWQLAYGEDGDEAAEQSTLFIPPYSTLIYTVHLSAVSK